MTVHLMYRKNSPLFLRLAASISLAAASLTAQTGGPSSFVNPFIGSANGGNTFPGAVRPWGMVSVSPHTDPSSPSGYRCGCPWFYGLGHVHLSGTGCADLGSILIIPQRGSLRTDPATYRCRIGTEEASPGFYAAELPETGVRVEATATERAGLTRITSLRDDDLAILIDAGRSLSLRGGGAVHFAGSREVEGYNIGGAFCGESNRHTVYFVARFSAMPQAHGVWVSDNLTVQDSASARDSSVGSWVRFRLKEGESVMIAVGVSYVSCANARHNLDAEIAGRSFESLKKEAAAAWDESLGRIRIKTTSRDDCVKFYTALYHALIHPSIISDVNGEYPAMGGGQIGSYADRVRYSVFSLWDTYRTLHPLLTLAYPERQSAIVQTMLDMYRESGWLPKWELAGNETFMMVGDPGAIVIADSYLNGIRGFDPLLAYDAVRKAATDTTARAEAHRPGYQDYLALGYIPTDQDTTRQWWVWGPVSTTLEYCLADWTIARMAERLGRMEESEEFHRRSRFYRNLYDSATGFLRPRLRDGKWFTPFDPLAAEGSGNWKGSGGPGYVEGNAWTYRWFVPHDIPRLIDYFGGSRPAAAKLEESFRNGQFTVTNEPDISYPYLFTYFPGQAYRTQELVDSIRQSQFGVSPSGLPGNDDAGTISAWFVFSALGFYPACPGSGEYRLGSPLFEELSLEPFPDSERKILIRRIGSVRRDGTGTRPRLSWNGDELRSPSIRHEDLTRGGMMVFDYGAGR